MTTKRKTTPKKPATKGKGTSTSAARGATARAKAATAPKRRAAAAAAPSAPTEREKNAGRRHKEAREAAEAAIEAAIDKKALVPVLLDVSDQATYTDFIGVVSGRSDRQVDAIAENVTAVMKQKGWRLSGREGAGNGRWTLLDFGEFVLHVFHHPVREFYDIEGLWIDAPRVKLKVPPEAMHVQSEAFYDTV